LDDEFVSEFEDDMPLAVKLSNLSKKTNKNKNNMIVKMAQTNSTS
jgi:hypothetical protein